MNIFDTLLGGVEMPKFTRVRYEVKQGKIKRDDIPGLVQDSIAERGVMGMLKPDDTVAIAASSRGINNYDRIIRALVDEFKARGALPFIFPAMGSHGGATAEGQLEILEGYGITAQSMGCPVISCMDTVEVGVTPHGIPVHIDAHAAKADWIVPAGRVKPHTEFRGRHESGLIKMLSIGCGKQFGAGICHEQGYPVMTRNITEIAEVVMKERRVLFGLAILEDAFHGTWTLRAVPGEQIEEEDAGLLEEAKALIPGIPFDKIDVLVLSEFGKDISGAGMDPNITGRSGTMGSWKPFVERICVLDLTRNAHHNAAGIGVADVTTQRLFDKMRFDVTYPNGITSQDLTSLKIPPVMPDDRSAIRMGLHTVTQGNPNVGMRVVWMQNTLAMQSFLISESLAEEAARIPGMTVCERGIEIGFDEKGNAGPELNRYFV